MIPRKKTPNIASYSSTKTRNVASAFLSYRIHLKLFNDDIHYNMLFNDYVHDVVQELFRDVQNND